MYGIFPARLRYKPNGPLSPWLELKVSFIDVNFCLIINHTDKLQMH